MTRHDRESTDGSTDGRRASGRPRPWSSIDPDDLSAEERERLEARSDPLIDLVGHVERQRPDSAAYEDPRFLAWLAREELDEHELLGPEEIGALAGRVIADLEIAELGVRAVGGAPELRPVTSPGPVSVMVDEAGARGEVALLDLRVAAGIGRELWDAECESCIPLPEDVPRGRYLALEVSGESMTPLMHPGDVVLVKLGAEVAPNSVVVARGPDEGYVVKRVGRLTSRAIELLSLNPAFEPVRVSRVADRILGTVVLRWCAHGG